MSHPARIAAHDAPVLSALGSKQHDFLHVGPQHLVLGHAQRLIDQVQELAHVAQQLLADPLARAVDGALHVGRGVQHGGGEHGNADGLAEPVYINCGGVRGMSSELEREFGDIAEQYGVRFYSKWSEGSDSSETLVNSDNKKIILIARQIDSSNGAITWQFFNHITNIHVGPVTNLINARAQLSIQLKITSLRIKLGTQATPDAWHALSRLLTIVERLALR